MDDSSVGSLITAQVGSSHKSLSGDLKLKKNENLDIQMEHKKQCKYKS